MARGSTRSKRGFPEAPKFALARADLVSELIGCGQVRKNEAQMRQLWEFKLRREGAWDETYRTIRDRYDADKKAWQAADPATRGNAPSYRLTHVAVLKETGFTQDAAWRWWHDFVKDKEDLERAVWAKEVVGMENSRNGRRGTDSATIKLGDWRRDDLPDDIAWVASRKCLMDERQQNENKPPLTDDDFHDCPSPQARVMLAVAYQNPAKFIGTLMDTMKQQWGKKKVDVAVETKAAVAERVEEKKEEVAPPKPLEVSDAAKLVAKLLQGG